MRSETRVPIQTDADILTARQLGRTMAARMGFSSVDQTVIATAVSEIARNIVEHAREGEVILSAIHIGSRRGIQVVARDEGPGIPDIGRAMQDRFSTGPGLGLGLPGTRRLMDDFDVQSQRGRGTVVTMRKWKFA